MTLIVNKYCAQVLISGHYTLNRYSLRLYSLRRSAKRRSPLKSPAPSFQCILSGWLLRLLFTEADRQPADCLWVRTFTHNCWPLLAPSLQIGTSSLIVHLINMYIVLRDMYYDTILINEKDILRDQKSIQTGACRKNIVQSRSEH